MAQRTLAAVLEYLRTGHAAQELEQLADGELLGRFLTDRDEAAFAVLVHHHGPMILGVCRRVLGDGHHAEDAFQATFLVLVRRAAAIHRQAPLGPWLYGVARRVALKARARAAARQSRQRELADMPRTEPLDERTWQEMRPVLDEEIGRLPEKCRAPLVMCYFEGKSYDEAAQELGWPKSSLASRLARGRDLLRQRLVRRGITLSAGALTTALAEKATAVPVVALLTINLVRAAANVANGKTLAAECLSTRAIALAEEAMKSDIGIKGKLVLLLLALGLAAGAALAGYEAWVRPTPPERQPPVAQRDPQKKPAPGPAKDPLPAGAVVRLGQDRWLHDISADFAAFLPDGKSVLTVCEDGSSRVWEFPSGKELLRFAPAAPGNLAGSGIRSAMRSGRIQAALTKDGTTLATWYGVGREIALHDVATGKQLPGLKVNEEVIALAFSPQGDHLASGEGDGTVRIWDWARAKEVRRFAAGAGSLPLSVKLAYAPDGKSLATSSLPTDRSNYARVIQMWDPATGGERWSTRSEGTSNLLSLAFSPDSKTLAVARGGTNPITLLEVATGKETGKLATKKMSGGGLVFAHDGTRLYAGHGGAVVEWDLATRKVLRECAEPSNPASLVYHMALSPDGNVLILSGVGPDFFDLTDGKAISGLNFRTPPLLGVQFLPGGTRLITQQAQSLQKWDAVTGKNLGPVPLPTASQGHTVSPDGKLLASVVRVPSKSDPNKLPPPQVVLVDTASGKELVQVALQRTAPPSTDTGILEGFPAMREKMEQVDLAMSFSPDSKTLAIRQPLEGKIELLAIPAARPLHTLKIAKRNPGPGQVHLPPTMMYSPDGKTFAAFADADTMGLWNTATGRRISSLPTPRVDSIRSGVFSPDGRLALDLNDGTVILYELATARPPRTFGEKSPVVRSIYRQIGACVAFSPDGTLLAQGGSNRLVRVWDVQTGRKLAEFTGHEGAVTALAFSPDGRRLASASADSTTLIWDLTKLKRPAPR
jgi:RNA polymerase sigma factor (sigma-70 family)